MELKTEIIISTGLILAMVALIYIWAWWVRRKENKDYLMEVNKKNGTMERS